MGFSIKIEIGSGDEVPGDVEFEGSIEVYSTANGLRYGMSDSDLLFEAIEEALFELEGGE